MITNEIIQSFLKCQYKSYLQFHQRVGNKTDYERLEYELLDAYKARFYQNLQTKFSKEQIFQEVPFKKNHNITETTYVVRPIFRSHEYTISLDLIKIIPHKKFPKELSYLPIEIISREKLSKTEKLSFAIRCVILSQLQCNFFPEFGQILYRQNFKTTRINLTNYSKEAKQKLKELKSIVHNKEVPSFYQNSHCAVCEFQEICKTKLVEKNDLSLLGGMNQKEILKKNNRGIFTVLQFSYTFKPRRKRKKDINKPHHCEWALKALALREKRTYIQEIPQLPEAETEIYLDFEGLPDENFIYLIGLIIKKNEIKEHFSFWADSVKNEEHIFVQLFDTLSHFKDFKVYHYGSYEIRAMKRLNKKLNNRYENEINQIIERAVNILTFLSFAVYPPTFTNGLKDIAQFLGFKWSEIDASGLQSIIWRKKWELSYEAKYKNKLIRYNLEDCQALKTVKNWLANIGEEIGEEHEQNFVKVEDIPVENIRKFGKTNYQLPDLEKVNKYAYFDYQRSKIYLRTNENIKKALREKAKTHRHVNEVDKIITVYPDNCPNCELDEFYKYQKYSKTVIDLKFMKHGIKKWVVQFDSGRFMCRNCKAKVTPQKFKKISSYYGHNLIAWSINQHITYRIGMNKVMDILLQSFSIKVPVQSIYTFKTRISEQYADTFAEIKHNMLRGNLIHVDETDVTVRGFSSPYVWVFTSMDSVCYLFRPNREVEFLKDFLQGFEGVLISDFYPGYDALSCLHQKCLIHLIRDLNNDLLHNQLDLEYKGMVISFGKLLRIIIDTVDKYGLKKKHLHKHKKDVEKFYRRIFNADYESELAIKYQTRFEKNQDRLFTFLDHDGIPWNNNNAEHAIKPFAKYRRDNDGLFTEKTIKEYLISLSIQQTCKYRGISFLEFLKSGEKSIEVYSHKN